MLTLDSQLFRELGNRLAACCTLFFTKRQLSSLALPRRCAASLRLAGKDLLKLAVSDRPVEDHEKNRVTCRQVGDLPRIGVAKPDTR